VNVDKRKVLVTGASRGLGLAISRHLLRVGYHVIGTARSGSEPFLAMAREISGPAAFVSFDVSRTDEIHSFSQRIHNEFGRLFGLVNNAGMGRGGILSTMHESDIEAMLRVNLHAPILLTKYLSRGMLANGLGRIINVSSIIATTGFSGLAVYGATKAGLIGMSRSLARELGKAGVTVNCVLPGYMETDMTHGLTGDRLDSVRRRSPMSRFASVDEVASAVAFLLSDEAAGITGTTITVDAGSTA